MQRSFMWRVHTLEECSEKMRARHIGGFEHGTAAVINALLDVIGPASGGEVDVRGRVAHGAPGVAHGAPSTPACREGIAAEEGGSKL